MFIVEPSRQDQRAQHRGNSLSPCAAAGVAGCSALDLGAARCITRHAEAEGRRWGRTLRWPRQSEEAAAARGCRRCRRTERHHPACLAILQKRPFPVTCPSSGGKESLIMTTPRWWRCVCVASPCTKSPGLLSLEHSCRRSAPHFMRTPIPTSQPVPARAHRTATDRAGTANSGSAGQACGHSRLGSR